MEYSRVNNKICLVGESEREREYGQAVSAGGAKGKTDEIINLEL